MAAKKKIPLGMFYLGLAYSIGDGVETNDDYAVRWIRAAAERELTMAQLTLGMKLALGDGVAKNLELAVQWLRRATLNGSAEAALQLRKYENTLLRQNGEFVNFSEDQPVNEIASRVVKSALNVDNREKFTAKENFEISRPPFPATDDDELSNSLVSTDDAGNLETENMNELGLVAYKNKDFKNSKAWFEKAGKLRHPESLRYLGIQYFLGQGVQIDYQTAAYWLEESIKEGDLEASRYLRIVKQFR